MWYKSAASPHEDVVTNVRTGRLWFNTPYVEILSRTEAKMPLRSQESRIRIFTHEAEAIGQLIRDALPPGGNT